MAKLRERLTPKNEEILTQKLRRIQRQLNDAQRTAFAVAVARVANRFTLKDIADLSELAFGQSAIFAAQCVEGISSLDTLEKAGSEVIKHSSSGVWAVEFFWSMRHKRELLDGDDDVEKFLPEETTKRLGALLAETLLEDIESSMPRPSMELLRRAFLIIERHGDLDRVRRWTKSELMKDETFIGPLIGLTMRGLYSGGKRDQEWPGDKEALRKVKAYTDAEWLGRVLKLVSEG